MLLLIDNYDSFVYNLARYFVELGCETRVVRNDMIDVATIRAMLPDAVLISPGPCTPNDAGASVELVAQLSDRIPILGVCLGHQAIAAALGGKVIRANEPVHGRTSLIEHSGTDLFAGMPSPLRVARYHSLIVDEATLPTDLVITARTHDGIPMAVQHRSRPLYGVQFHPEAVLTEHGRLLLSNFAKIAGLQPIDYHVQDWNPPLPSENETNGTVLAW
jgi:anthranilate synthase/aminodeoxychorismate synthase-like glutamine amidotransferase